MSQLWEEGQYEGALKEALFTETKSGSPQVELTFTIEGVGKKVYLSLNGGAEQYTMEKLRRLGWNGDPEAPSFAAATAPVLLNMKHDTYNGNTKERWDIAPTGKPMSNDRARAIAQKFKSTSPSTVGRPTTPPPVSKPAGGPPSRPPITAPARPPVATDRNEAWEALREQLKKEPEDAAWFSTIGRVEKDTGKKEDDFGTFEWSKVVADYPPF